MANRNQNFNQPPPRMTSAPFPYNTNSGYPNSIPGNITPIPSLLFQQPPPSMNQHHNRSGQMGMMGSASMNNSRRVFQNPQAAQIPQRSGPNLSGFGPLPTANPIPQSPQRYAHGNSSFQSSYVSTPPTLLDMSEFPSLTSRPNEHRSNATSASNKQYGKRNFN